MKDYNAETNLSSLAILRLLNLRLCFSSITKDYVVYVVDGGGQGERLQRRDQSLVSSYLKVVKSEALFFQYNYR